MGFSQLSLRVGDGLARLTFTDAARGNPIDAVLCAEMGEAAIQLSEDPDVRCVLIAAESKAFSYGGDSGSPIMHARRMGVARKRRFLLLNETLDAPAALAVR